jgi:hypothetical protein
VVQLGARLKGGKNADTALAGRSSALDSDSVDAFRRHTVLATQIMARRPRGPNSISAPRIAVVLIFVAVVIGISVVAIFYPGEGRVGATNYAGPSVRTVRTVPVLPAVAPNRP